MKKVKSFLTTLLPSLFAVGMCLPAFLNSPKTIREDPGEDTAIYSDNLAHAKLASPDITSRLDGDDDEDEEVVIEVDKVILHYYKEEVGCH